MIKKIQEWLSKPKRDYASGLAFFEKLADENMKKVYGHFLKLKAEDEEIKSFDPRFPVLINKVNTILHRIKQDPEKYIDKVATEPTVTESIRTIIRNTAQELKTLRDEKTSLEEEIEELRGSGDEKDDEIASLEGQIEEKDDEIATLQEELDEKLKTSGLKIVLYSDMPEGTQKKYNRAQEITPLIAKIHSELSACASDEERKALAAELCKLDDERRKIWDAIDDWSNGKEAVFSDPERPKGYSEDPLVKGMQVSNRINRLTENITRTKAAIDKHTAAGKENLALKAKTRLAEYEQELEELKAFMPKE